METAEIIEDIKITGEVLEKVLDLCHDFGLFDFFFAPEKNTMTDYETKIITQIFDRKAKLGDDFKPDDEELKVWVKVMEQNKTKEYDFKKKLMLKENRDFLRTIHSLFNPTRVFDFLEAIDDLSRRIPTVKNLLGFL